jgi:hypothetical protein
MPAGNKRWKLDAGNWELVRTATLVPQPRQLAPIVAGGEQTSGPLVGTTASAPYRWIRGEKSRDLHDEIGSRAGPQARRQLRARCAQPSHGFRRLETGSSRSTDAGVAAKRWIDGVRSS